MKIKVGVIFGGETVEHEVSIITAVQAMNAMDTDKYDIIPIYISKDRTWYTGSMLQEMDIYKDFDLLKRYAKMVTLIRKDGTFYLQSLKGFKKIVTELDVVFPMVHGSNVEDGTLQGYLETLNIPYVGSNVTGSALGQDKVIMKQIFEACHLPFVPYVWFFDTEFVANQETILKDIQKIGYPVIVKPATLGSSIGITYVKDETKLESAIQDAMEYDKKIIVEKAIENLIEVNCSVLGNYEYQQTSEIEEVMGTADFLTYADKYIGGGKKKMPVGGSKGMASASRIIPARMSEKETEEIKELAKGTFRALNLSGICRIDFLIDAKAKKSYINEPNTIPGSLSFYLWEATGKEYRVLLDDLITLAIKDYKKKTKKTTSFDTNILQNFNGLKGGKGMKGKLK